MDSDTPETPDTPVEPEQVPGWGGYVYISLLQLGFVFALYVFSAGPLYWWIFEAYTFGENPLLQRMYRPLIWLAERSSWFSDFLDWWVGLWIL